LWSAPTLLAAQCSSQSRRLGLGVKGRGLLIRLLLLFDVLLEYRQRRPLLGKTWLVAVSAELVAALTPLIRKFETGKIAFRRTGRSGDEPNRWEIVERQVGGVPCAAPRHDLIMNNK
jgi:hypothetical protein